jgi:uncharacterized protein
MDMNQNIVDKVNETFFVDTHEHLLEESQRLAGPSPNDPFFICDDWAYLFAHYAHDDLKIAGLPQSSSDKLMSRDLSPTEKWDLVAPYWTQFSNTTYAKAALISIKQLFGEDEVSASTVDRITTKLRAGIKKGYYYTVLRDVARVESCQVNNLVSIFRTTEYPDLLHQDISTVPLSTDLNLDHIRQETGLPINNLGDFYQAIDWYFEAYGQNAIATKNQSAYTRRLDYLDVSQEDASPLFDRLVKDPKQVQPRELKAIQDHLFRYCVNKATHYQLPVKLHTGYFAGTGYMPLANVSQNLKDLCPILQSFPDTKFVLMHIAFPYQDEMIALAKHYGNVYVDLCWAWIVNPVATVQFVQEFLTAVPSNKLLTFGGDYLSVENVVGHAAIARHGLALAITNLITDSWITEREGLDLVTPLMHDNAWSLFRMAEKSRR